MALNFLNRGHPLVGLDIGSSAIKAVELRSQSDGRYKLVALGVEELSPGCIIDGAITAKLLYPMRSTVFSPNRASKTSGWQLRSRATR